MPINYEVLSIAFCVIDGLAVILTFFRLGFRLKIQRFWWEDGWAAIASLCTVVAICSLLIAAKSLNYESVLLAGKIRAYMFISITWSVRMSVISSIIRIASSTVLCRILLLTAACFIFFWAATFGLQSWWCVHITTTMLGNPGPNCMLPECITIFEVATNIVADVVTVLFSFKLLWGIKLPQRQRRMILYLFSSSIYLCIISLVHAISQLAGSKAAVAQEILAFLQVTIFMVVCNLLVVVTFVYRIFWISRDSDPLSELGSSYDDDFTTPLPRTQDLTTVDLESVRTSGCYRSAIHSSVLEDSHSSLRE